MTVKKLFEEFCGVMDKAGNADAEELMLLVKQFKLLKAMASQMDKERAKWRTPWECPNCKREVIELCEDHQHLEDDIKKLII